MTAAEHSKPWRRTPLIYSTKLSKEAGCQIYLKLENLQPSGSFKSRGIGNFLLSYLEALSGQADGGKIHFYSSSGGNAGLACVHAAVTLGAAATIVVPLTTSAYMISKMKDAGASEILQEGASWVEADSYLKNVAMPAAEQRGEKAVYVPPFDAQEIWDGHSTIIPEVLADLGEAPAAVVCSVGGGGLLCGIMQGLSRAGEQCQKTQVLAVETKGADSLALSLKEGKLSTLPGITSQATTLGARTVASRAFEYGTMQNVRSVVLSDLDAMEGSVRFANDERIMVELACGVSVALCYRGRVKKNLSELTKSSKVVIVVCGGSNVSESMLHAWAEQLHSPSLDV